jgi:thiopurine S-methyltransferase
MQSDFWRDRWREGKIGFHEGKPNDFLQRYGARLAGCRRVLVPLCGKSDDLAYLAAQGHEVVGVELVEEAVKQFFVEHAIAPEVTRREPFAVYRANALTIFAGDFFATTAELIGPIEAIYDRAALVALPRDMRAKYVAHVRAIAPSARTTLLVSLEYPEDAMEGPPFCVAEAEVRTLYADKKIELLDEQSDPRGRLDGRMIERCYVIS